MEELKKWVSSRCQSLSENFPSFMFGIFIIHHPGKKKKKPDGFGTARSVLNVFFKIFFGSLRKKGGRL